LIGEFSGVVGHLETIVARRPVLAGSYHFDQVVQMVRESRLEPSFEVEPVENEDECTFLATFECGAHGFFRASRVRAEQRLLVSGSRGELLWHLDEDRLWKRPDGQSAFVEIELPEKAHALTFVDPFVQDILRDTGLGPSFYDGLRAQAVIEAVLASAADGRWTSVPATDGAGPIGGNSDQVGLWDVRSN
jgi:predicted dehydrogenase